MFDFHTHTFFSDGVLAPTELIRRRRVFPSGVPEEEARSDSGPDLSWRDDLNEFERRVSSGESSYGTDAALSACIRNLGQQMRLPCE